MGMFGWLRGVVLSVECFVIYALGTRWLYVFDFALRAGWIREGAGFKSCVARVRCRDMSGHGMRELA